MAAEPCPRSPLPSKRHRWTLQDGRECEYCRRLNFEVGHPLGSERYTNAKRDRRTSGPVNSVTRRPAPVQRTADERAPVSVVPVVASVVVDESPTNPWIDLPTQPPYLLPADAAVLRPHDIQRHEIKLHHPPCPYMGDPRTAAVIFLSNNPRWNEATDRTQGDEYNRENIAGLTFQSAAGLYSLDDRFVGTGGYDYWSSSLRHLIARFGLDAIRRSVAVADWFPYPSPNLPQLNYLLPSQAYTFALVEQAARRGALVVAICGVRHWSRLPALARSLPRLRNPQQRAVSPGNLDPGVFEQICGAIQARLDVEGA